MKVIDVIAMAQLQAEEVYDDPTWIQYINAALDDLTPIAKILKSKDEIAVTATAGIGKIDIISDTDLVAAHEILTTYYKTGTDTLRQLRRIPMSDNASEGWKLTTSEIIMQNIAESGTARVDYYKKLQHVKNTSEDIETTSGLPSQYHHLLVLYALAKSQQKEEELNDKNDAYTEYLMGKQQMGVDRIWEMEPHNRKYIKKARIAMLLGGGGQQG